MDTLNYFLPTIAHWGLWIYWLLLLISTLESVAFVGLIIPGTTVVIFAGFLASQKIIDLGDAIWFVALGGIIGDGVSFYLGKRGVAWFKKDHKFFKLSYLKRGEEFFRKHGEKSVISARFIGPLRGFIPFVAGLFKMRSRKFFLFNFLGTFAGATFYLGLGFFFGEAWGRAAPWIERFKVGLLIAAAVFAVGYVLNKIFLKKK